MGDKLQIMELFGPTIQGEGIMTGTVTHFLRTGGCSLRCSWCDSLFAVLPAEVKKYRRMMSTADVLKELSALPHAPYVTFTGGDPCIQPLLGDLIATLNYGRMRVAVETQGMFFPDWLERVDVVTFSPKGPSSGNIVDIEDLMKWLRDYWKRTFRICIKIVCFDDEDYAYAMGVYNTIPEQLYDAFYFTAGTPIPDPDIYVLDNSGRDALATARTMEVLANQNALATSMLKDAARFNSKVHLGCQQHVLLWPNENKGV